MGRTSILQARWVVNIDHILPLRIAAMAQDEQAKKSFKDTLNLPHTDFPIRANAQIEDPKIIDRWKKDDVYTKTFHKNEGKQTYLLHDGPPYANGISI